MVAVTHLSRIALTLCAHGFGPLIFELGIQEIIRVLPKGEKWGKPRAQTIGKRLRLLFEELGPTFQKFGQMLSTQSDLLPDDVIVELQKLQTDIPPMSSYAKSKILKKELGRKNPLVKSIEKKPQAVATIGQLHRAILPTGQLVAVKIQHPGIEKTIKNDLNALMWIARTVLNARPEWKRYNIMGILQLFKRSLLSELDFKNEAKQFRSMADQAKKLGIKVPRIHSRYCTEKILVMDWVEGEPVTRLLSQAPTPQTIEVAEKLLHLILDQVFVRGHFHGDPHPGNFLVTKEGQLFMIDLGLTGTLKRHHRKALVQALKSVLSADAKKMATALIAMSSFPTGKNPKEMKAILAPHLEKIFHEIKDGAGLESSLQKIFRKAASLDVIVDVEYVLMLKTLLTVESLCRQLHPEIKIFAIARPVVFKGLFGWANPLQLLRSRLS